MRTPSSSPWSSSSPKNATSNKAPCRNCSPARSACRGSCKENAIAVYTSELDYSAGGADPEVLVQDRLKKGRERLDNTLETLDLLCEPVEPPRGELEHM